MKNSIYILIIVFLTYGKGFASSINFSNVLGVISIENLTSSENKLYFENDFCKDPLNKCSNHKFLMNKDGIFYTESYHGLKEMKALNIVSIYYTPINTYKTTNSLHYRSLEEFSTTYISPINFENKRLQNIDTEHYFSQQPIDPTYYKGFGIRLRIN